MKKVEILKYLRFFNDINVLIPGFDTIGKAYERRRSRRYAFILNLKLFHFSGVARMGRSRRRVKGPSALAAGS